MRCTLAAKIPALAFALVGAFSNGDNIMRDRPRPGIIPESEELVAVLHEHPITMAKTFLVVLPLLGIGTWLAVLDEEWQPWGLGLAGFAVIAMAARVVWWRLAPVYYITNRQATVKQSVIGSDFSSIIFSDVTGKDYERGVLGHILGYGNLTLSGREKTLVMENIPLRPAAAMCMIQELVDDSQDSGYRT